MWATLDSQKQTVNIGKNFADAVAGKVIVKGTWILREKEYKIESTVDGFDTMDALIKLAKQEGVTKLEKIDFQVVN